MREGISYAFLLNIIILFVTVCAAVIMGIFSYNRAFRANSIITSTIEKYEGYNCLAKEEIEKKLSSISYNTPFRVRCNYNDIKCETNSAQTYKVISYNLDFDPLTNKSNRDLVEKHIDEFYVYGEKMNSPYQCDNKNNNDVTACTTNKYYQYGVYTYMYFDIPVISKLARLPFYARTSKMYEFRNFYVDDGRITDVEAIFESLYRRQIIDNKIYVSDAIYGKKVIEKTNGNYRTDMPATEFFGTGLLGIYSDLQTGKTLGSYEYLFTNKTGDSGVNYRIRAMLINVFSDRILNANLSTKIYLDGFSGNRMRRECGFKLDYEKVNETTEAFR